MRLRLLPGPRCRRVLLLLAVSAGLAAALFGRPATVWLAKVQARSALELRDAERALSKLERAEAIDRSDAEVAFLLARAYRRLGQLDRVRESLERAWRLGYPVQRLQREQWLVLAQSGQLTEAEPHLRKLLLSAGDDGPEICEAFVNGYMAVYRLREARTLLNAWRQDHPLDEQPHFIEGLLALHPGDPSTAVRHFERALELAPHRRDIRLKLATALVELHEYGAAREHFRMLLEDRDYAERAEVLASWGNYLLAVHRTAEARECFARLLDEHPAHFEARVAMARLELEAGRAERAFSLIEPACNERPYSMPARFILARVLRTLGRDDEAGKHFEWFQQAEREMRRAVEIIGRVVDEPNNAELRYELGSILFNYDSPPDGARWMHSVLAIQPDHTAAHAALARYYEQSGQQALAAPHRRLSETGSPGNG